MNKTRSTTVGGQVGVGPPQTKIIPNTLITRQYEIHYNVLFILIRIKYTKRKHVIMNKIRSSRFEGFPPQIKLIPSKHLNHLAA